MGQYTPGTFSNGAVIDADAIQAEFNKIATAHNDHSTADFGSSGQIPLSALDTREAYSKLTVGIESVATGAAVGTVQNGVPCPCAGAIVAVYATCVDVNSGTVTVDLYDETQGTPATVLTGTISLTANNTAVAGTVSGGSYDMDAGDVLTLRVAQATGGAVGPIVVSILFKEDLQ